MVMRLGGIMAEGINKLQDYIRSKSYLEAVLTAGYRNKGQLKLDERINISGDLEVTPLNCESGHHRSPVYKVKALIQVGDGNEERYFVYKKPSTDRDLKERPWMGEYEEVITSFTNQISKETGAKFEVPEIYTYDPKQDILIMKYEEGIVLSKLINDIDNAVASSDNRKRVQNLYKIKSSLLNLSLGAVAHYQHYLDRYSQELERRLEQRVKSRKNGLTIYNPTPDEEGDKDEKQGKFNFRWAEVKKWFGKKTNGNQERGEHYKEKMMGYLTKILNKNGINNTGDDIYKTIEESLEPVIQDLVDNEERTIIMADCHPDHIRIRENEYLKEVISFINSNDRERPDRGIDPLCKRLYDSTKILLLSLEDTRFGPEKLDVASLIGHHSLDLTKDRMIEHLSSFLRTKFSLSGQSHYLDATKHINRLDSALFYVALKGCVGGSSGLGVSDEEFGYYMKRINNLLESKLSLKPLDDILGETFREIGTKYTKKDPRKTSNPNLKLPPVDK